MSSLEIGQRVEGLKRLSHADPESDAADFVPDSYVLILADNSSIVITSATDWTLEVEPGTWPSLPSWAWPPERWRYEDVDSPLGAPGFDVIRGLADLRNDVDEVGGVEISFDLGTIRLEAGDSVVYSMARSRSRIVMGDNEFRALCAAFVQGRTTGVEFEGEFLNLWRRCRDLGAQTSAQVDRLFTDVDVFCGDLELWEEGDLDEEGLRVAAAHFLRGTSGSPGGG